jgi:fused signal recognition particle receptor
MRKKNLALRLKELLGAGKHDAEYFEELEEILIEADIGPALAMEVVGELQKEAGRGGPKDRERTLDILKRLLGASLRTEQPRLVRGELNVFLLLGVNGVGKTTTIAKLAEFYRRHEQVSEILLSAADTYRAAAIDQLLRWGERLKLPVVHQEPGADPGAVIFDSLSSAQARGTELVLADTAGRLHNKAHLVKELGKVDKIIRGRIGDGNYRKLLVIDATTGQNALKQAEVFNEAVGVDAIVMAKYDSTAKGGVAVAICRQLGIPFAFLGQGEKLEDLRPFDPDFFLEELLTA